MLTDRQRVEIMLPAQIMLGVLLCGANDREAEDFARARDALIEASDQVVHDLPAARRAQIIRRTHRLHLEATEPYRKDGARVDKMGLIAFYWLRELMEQEYLVLHQGSPMARALDIMVPALERAAAIERLDASAQKSARKFLLHLQGLGYYRGVAPLAFSNAEGKE
jgi:hypothetical protein